MNETNCIFCKILGKEIPAKPIYEDEQVIAINDIDPKAPTHILILPRQHIATLNDLPDGEIVGHMVHTASKLAKKLELAEDGYRVVLNCNQEGGQAVYHIHAHLLAGRKMTWPPG
jgi:histidine triad (HIT) family protein